LSSSHAPYGAEDAQGFNEAQGFNGVREYGVMARWLRRTSRVQSRPGIALAIMLGAQLMIILDMTVVNIALPHIQSNLRFSPSSLS
jgi:hypothetical protein